MPRQRRRAPRPPSIQDAPLSFPCNTSQARPFTFGLTEAEQPPPRQLVVFTRPGFAPAPPRALHFDTARRVVALDGREFVGLHPAVFLLLLKLAQANGGKVSGATLRKTCDHQKLDRLLRTHFPPELRP